METVYPHEKGRDGAPQYPRASVPRAFDPNRAGDDLLLSEARETRGQGVHRAPSTSFRPPAPLMSSPPPRRRGLVKVAWDVCTGMN